MFYSTSDEKYKLMKFFDKHKCSISSNELFRKKSFKLMNK